MLNYYYGDQISNFLSKPHKEIVGALSSQSQFDITLPQRQAWIAQIEILKKALVGLAGDVFFEFSIPRMGKRVDCLVITEDIIFVLEFKVGSETFNNQDIDQVWDYALDLKNFHQPSHSALLIPILVATEAKAGQSEFVFTIHNDNLVRPIKASPSALPDIFRKAILWAEPIGNILADDYIKGRYAPTPTIIEAAISLFNNHSVDEITRSDAAAINLSFTSEAISKLIVQAKANSEKIICFVTGVPGAGKTLVGLKVATAHLDGGAGMSSVYLSGNGPLVLILQEALARDKVSQELRAGRRITKGQAKNSVKAFIQNIHHYRDEYLLKKDDVPYDHVAIFDEAQRAWDKEQTSKFMIQKKGQAGFDASESEFLISCLDRHKDWAVIVCLVGGGQELNTGEAGISEWLKAISEKFPKWKVAMSPNLAESEYSVQMQVEQLQNKTTVISDTNLHLKVSLRSFRAETLSQFVQELLNRRVDESRSLLLGLKEKYPLVLTRDLNRAKDWIRTQARGTERYGMVVSSRALRLKPLAIDVRAAIDPVYWFLNGKDDVRSSYFLEDVATEFDIQGLELDWTCVIWDGDLRHGSEGWLPFDFRGDKWQNVRSPDRQRYLVNAYRVLLTRARQGMVIVVPEGSQSDHTRKPEYYDSTYNYLVDLGLFRI